MSTPVPNLDPPYLRNEDVSTVFVSTKHLLQPLEVYGDGSGFYVLFHVSKNAKRQNNAFL